MNMSARIMNWVGVAVCLTSTLLCSPAQGVPPNWIYEGVDPAKTFGGYSASLDSGDHAHVMYGRDALHYDWEEADGWHSETVDRASAPSGISMVLDDAGHPHVVYVDLLTTSLKYARWGQAGWSVEVVATDVGDPNATAICLDPAGTPHVGYFGAYFSDVTVNHASRDASGWDTTTAIWKIADTRSLQIAITVVRDRPHIGGTGRRTIFHAWQADSGWQAAQETLTSFVNNWQVAFDRRGQLHAVCFEDDDAGWEGVHYVLLTDRTFVDNQLFEYHIQCHPKLAISPADVVHVTCWLYGNDLRHWSRTVRGEWTTSRIDTYGQGGGDWLALDADAQPVVVYRVHEGGGFFEYATRMARLSGDDWIIQPMPSISYYGGREILVKQDGRPCLVYDGGHHNDEADTAFLELAGDAWDEHVLVDTTPTHGWTIHASLAVDAQGIPHIGYGIRYATREDGRWHLTEIPDGLLPCDLALDDTGRPHMGYMSADRGVQYAALDDAGWSSVEAYAFPEPTRFAFALALDLDGEGRPHIVFSEGVQDLPYSPRLVHVWQNSGGWQSEDVVQFSENPDVLNFAFPQVGVDRMQQLHICFFDFTNDALCHGLRTETGWALTTVDGNGLSVGASCSMDLDVYGQPHIAYTVGGPSEIRYAWKDATGWNTEVLASGLEPGGPQFISLQLAEDGMPHVAYITRKDLHGSLMYARRGPDGWNEMELERITWPESNPVALSVGPSGDPHVAYYNHFRQQLGYLHLPSFVLTGLTRLGASRLRLDWQGASEGLGVDGAPSPAGPWSPVATDLSGLACELEVLPTAKFFRLRQAGSP